MNTSIKKIDRVLHKAIVDALVKGGPMSIPDIAKQIQRDETVVRRHIKAEMSLREKKVGRSMIYDIPPFKSHRPARHPSISGDVQ